MPNMIQAFQKAFETTHTPRVFFAPGRVNLIGEYTDFNGGNVLPCALKRGTYAAARLREDRIIRFFSNNFVDKGIEIVEMEQLPLTMNDHWTDYPKGVVDVLRQHGHELVRGFDICYFGDIPHGAGLSSSASIELVTLVAINQLFGLRIDPVTMALYAQEAENDFVGVKCGIMDQFIISVGKENHAVLLNTATLAYTYAKVNLQDYTLIISNTNKKRGLSDSKYNERFAECREALYDLQKVLPIKSLGELDEKSFESYATYICNDKARKRAKHAVYENRRTLRASESLNAGRLIEFGKLMNASHKSLKEDFEVSGSELDTLVELAQSFEGVIGSRMTGAGFGGCTVTLIEKDKVNGFIDCVGKLYREACGYCAEFYRVEIGDAARELIQEVTDEDNSDR